MARSIFVPLNIVYGVAIVSLLVVKFSRRDHSKITNASVDELRYEENPYRLWEHSLIRALRANLDAANDDETREKEFLQFLCALLVIHTTFEEAASLSSQVKEFEKKLVAFGEDTRTKSSGSSMFASAANVYAHKTSGEGYGQYYEQLKTFQGLTHDEVVDSVLSAYLLFETYNQTKMVRLLRKFGIAFQSVEEIIRNEGQNWDLTSGQMKVINTMLNDIIETGFRAQWKWVHKRRNIVFPLVSVDKCEVLRLIGRF